jgi:dihydrofolate synthase / folylpolyglutamate synthase
VLRQSGWNLKDDLIQKGLSRVALNTGFCGRFQIISKQPLVILDAAHNEDGIRVFFEELKQVEFDSLHVVYGASNDKDLKGIFHVFPSNAKYYFSEFDSKRSTKIDELRTLSEAVSLEAGFYTEPEQAFQAAKQAASPGDLIAVIGSFYLIQSFL